MTAPQLPLACLDFSGRSTVTLQEIAQKLGISCDTMERHVDDGSIEPINLAPKSSSRRLLRFAIDEYRRFVLARLTSISRQDFLAHLPPETLREISAEIAARLAS